MILVVGATGQLGGAITWQLLDAGEDVRFLLRPNSPSTFLAQQGLATPADKLIAAGARPMTGDLGDRAALENALRGVDVVITTANSALRQGPDTVQAVDLEGNRLLVECAAAAGVNQFIFVSVLAADPASPVPFMAAKGATEQLLMAGTLPYTILAPDAFMDFWVGVIVGIPAITGQPVPIFGSGQRRHSFIAARDVAAFTIAAVENPAAINRRLPLGGPAAVSYMDVVETYTRVLGRPPALHQVAPGERVPGIPEAVLGLAAGMDQYDSIVPMEDLAGEFGVPMTDLETFARAQVAQMAATAH